MALQALAVYRDAIEADSPEIRPHLHGDDWAFDPGELIEARSVEASKAIAAEKGPLVIISASGMATGGRVLHHLAQRLPEPANSVVLVGFQVDGSRGRALVDGARTLKMLGRYVSVRAEVVSLPAFSAHADQGEIIAWLRGMPRPPEMLFTVHGEPTAAAGLRDAVTAELGWSAAVPRDQEVVRLD
jgi:metallo-beta-lactamase family protein